MNKVFILFDYDWNMHHGMHWKAMSGRFKTDVQTQTLVLTLLALKRTKLFCPDMVREIARHLWSMRAHGGELETVIPEKDFQLIRRTETLKIAMRDYCEKIDSKYQKCFVCVSERCASFIRQILPDADITMVSFMMSFQMYEGTEESRLQKLARMVVKYE